MADTTKISRREWLRYIERLRKLNDKAADSVKEYVNKNGGTANVDRQSLIDYAYGVATKYGEGAATLSAEMYDAVAMLEGKNIKNAVPADTPSYNDVAKTVNGILKQSANEEMLSSGVGRLVKRTGVDTVVNNALRDGAEWAWIPVGDTCAFCIMLASQGWVRASRKAIKNGHAEHIHANCDCTYAVRFDSNMEVEGYNPDEYRKIYYGAEGRTGNEKLNSIRRMLYAQNKNVVGDATDKAEELLVAIDDKFNDKARENISILNDFVNEYDSPLKTIIKGGAQFQPGERGYVGIGTRDTMNLKVSDFPTIIHEFAHTLAYKKEDALGLSNNKDFWNEIIKIRKEYNKARANDPSLSISAYAEMGGIDEFMAESFALAKLHELGYPITYQSGLREGGLPYAQRVLEIINKYFKRK